MNADKKTTDRRKQAYLKCIAASRDYRAPPEIDLWQGGNDNGTEGLIDVSGSLK